MKRTNTTTPVHTHRLIFVVQKCYKITKENLYCLNYMRHSLKEKSIEFTIPKYYLKTQNSLDHSR